MKTHAFYNNFRIRNKNFQIHDSCQHHVADRAKLGQLVIEQFDDMEMIEDYRCIPNMFLDCLNIGWRHNW